MDEYSYIIRIYRRDEIDGGMVKLTGIVEIADSGERLPFHDMDELWAILVRDLPPSENNSGHLPHP